MDDTRRLLRHMLGALAYRTQKALRDAPPGFSDYRPSPDVRSPKELVGHIDSVLGYARTFFVGGVYRPAPLPSLEDEVSRLHETLDQLSACLACDPFDSISDEQLLQGPLSDAMTHAGQIALLRRLYGSPVPPENFVFAVVSAENTSPKQARPTAPDTVWRTPDGREEERVDHEPKEEPPSGG